MFKKFAKLLAAVIYLSLMKVRLKTYGLTSTKSKKLAIQLVESLKPESKEFLLDLVLTYNMTENLMPKLLVQSFPLMPLKGLNLDLDLKQENVQEVK